MSLCSLCSSLTVENLYELAVVRNSVYYKPEAWRGLWGAPENAYYPHTQSFKSLVFSAETCDLCRAIKVAFEESGCLEHVRTKEAKGQATDVKLWLYSGINLLTSFIHSSNWLRYLGVQIGQEETSSTSSVAAAFGDDESDSHALSPETPGSVHAMIADPDSAERISALRKRMLMDPEMQFPIHKAEVEMEEIPDGEEDQWMTDSDDSQGQSALPEQIVRTPPEFYLTTRLYRFPARRAKLQI